MADVKDIWVIQVHWIVNQVALIQILALVLTDFVKRFSTIIMSLRFLICRIEIKMSHMDSGNMK